MYSLFRVASPALPRTLFRGLPPALFLALLALTLSACAWKTDERLEKLEAGARDQHILDLRLSGIEERMTRVEKTLGDLRDKNEPASASPAAPPARQLKKARTSNEKLAASPVILGTVPIDPPPAAERVAYLPAADPKAAAPPPSPVVGVGVAPVNDPFAGPGLTTVPLVSGSVEQQGARREDQVRPRPVAPRPEPAKSPASKAAPSGTGSAAYNAAYALYEKGDYAASQKAFADFLAASPKNSLAPNALYWQGECQYSLGKYDGAIIFFQDVINKYPRHAKAAASLLKAGYSYERLKDMDNARFYWQILVDDFPKSAPAALARKRLAG